MDIDFSRIRKKNSLIHSLQLTFVISLSVIHAIVT